MAETTVSEIQLLAEKINAQVQAHEKYSQAFMEILKTLDQINEQVQKVGINDGAALRALLEHVTVISSDLRHHHEDARGLKNNLETKIAEYHQSTQGFLHELSLQRLLVTEVGPMMRDLMKKYEESQHEMSNNFTLAFGKLQQLIEQVVFLHTSFHDEEIGINAKLDKFVDVPDMLAMLVKSRQGWRKIVTHSAYYALAVGSIWMLLQGLAQFGIILIKWFPR